MTEASFQPQGYLRFDLSQGQISTPDKRRHLVVPAELIGATGDDAALDEAAQRWGQEQGKALRSLIGDDLMKRTPERFITELAHVLATLGWGWCELESWGGVLFVVVERAPSGNALRILRHFLAGVFSSASGKAFGSVTVSDNGKSRFLLTTPDSVGVIEGWVSKGATVTDVVQRMLEGKHLSESRSRRGGR